jgi:hypothetical protein
VSAATAQAEADAISEMMAASNAPSRGAMSADERAALEMQEMQAAIDAERAERAAREAAAGGGGGGGAGADAGAEVGAGAGGSDGAAGAGASVGTGAHAADGAYAESASSASATATSDRPEPLSLAVRTSLLCEFRNSGGVLQAFEVCYGQTTFGVLCAALSRMPGVEFPDHNPQSWFRRPSRFTFRGQLYEVSIPHENIRVCPVNKGQALIEMEELLEYVRHNVLRSRASRYTVR